MVLNGVSKLLLPFKHSDRRMSYHCVSHSFAPRMQLRTFIKSTGFSEKEVNCEWDKFWSDNMRFLDKISPRYSAVVTENAIKLHLTNVDGIVGVEGALHPKSDMGTKITLRGPHVYIEPDDARHYVKKVGDKIALMHWGNVTVTGISGSGE